MDIGSSRVMDGWGGRCEIVFTGGRSPGDEENLPRSQSPLLPETGRKADLKHAPEHGNRGTRAKPLRTVSSRALSSFLEAWGHGAS